MKLIGIHALALPVVLTMAWPAISETWGCSEMDLLGRAELHPHRLELVADLENGFGSIHYEGLPVVIPTSFGIEGFHRAWRWRDEYGRIDSDRGYPFVINNDYGYYYVFLDDEPTSSQQKYLCHKH